MDFGTALGEFVVLPDPVPPHLPVHCKLHIYTYLRRSLAARKDLFARADAARFTSWSQVFVHHRYLLFPIVLNYSTTDDDLLVILDDRIETYFRHLHHQAQTNVPTSPTIHNPSWIPGTSSARPSTSWK